MGDASGRPAVSRDALIGKVALELGWVTPLQLRDALTEQWAEAEGGRPGARSLGTVLVARGLLTGTQLDQILERIGSPVPEFPPFGKYTLLREVGRGAMGVVYEAEDMELRRRVALKLVISPPARDPEESRPEQERFLREGQLQKSLPPHPGIVPVLEAGVIEERRYLAMELVDGVAMSSWHRHGSVTVRQRVALLRDVALAVHHAHRHGVIHRDLKPDNIIVDRSHQARISDFGLAKIVGSSAQPLATAGGAALGTPAYMSPEQIRGSKDVDARTDIYSLGVMLYEILTGRLPFTGANAYEIMMKTINDEVVPPSKIASIQINPVLYRNLENICLIALEKEPKDRYPDAEGFARDLAKWLKGEDVRVVVPKRWRMLRARRILPLLLTGAALAAVAAAGTFFLRRHDAPIPKGMPGVRVRIDSLQPGAVVESYAGVNFNVLGLRRIDMRSTFDDAGVPLWREGPTLWCSQRWSGYLRIFSAATYQFELSAKEQVRLVVDDVERASGTGPQAVALELAEGAHRIVLEHGHASDDDKLRVLWRKTGEPEAYPLGPVALSHLKSEFKPVAAAPFRHRLPNVPGAEEGELLSVVADSGHHASPHSYAMYGSFWKGTWSGDAHLWWGPGIQKGDRLRVRFAAGDAGRCVLSLGLTRAPDHGIFKVSVNGKVVAPELDLWSEDLVSGAFELQDVEVKAGSNDLEFEATGSNPGAREWGPRNGLHKLGIDYVLVR